MREGTIEEELETGGVEGVRNLCLAYHPSVVTVWPEADVKLTVALYLSDKIMASL